MLMVGSTKDPDHLPLPSQTEQWRKRIESRHQEESREEIRAENTVVPVPLGRASYECRPIRPSYYRNPNNIGFPFAPQPVSRA